MLAVPESTPAPTIKSSVLAAGRPAVRGAAVTRLRMPGQQGDRRDRDHDAQRRWRAQVVAQRQADDDRDHRGQHGRGMATAVIRDWERPWAITASCSRSS